MCGAFHRAPNCHRLNAVAGKRVLEGIDEDLLQKSSTSTSGQYRWANTRFSNERDVIRKALAFTPGDLLASRLNSVLVKVG